jgi:DNA-binding transcriptional ArsR family regulator
LPRPDESADAFPRISRPAVSRHLRVLRESGLVIAEQSGREWHYRLNVAALARMHRDWFARFTPLWEESLAGLKEQVEGAERSRRKRGA